MRSTLGLRALKFQRGPLRALDLREMLVGQLTAPRNLGGSGFLQILPRTHPDPAVQPYVSGDGYPIGDIDGDGVSDVLVEEYGQTHDQTSVMVETLRGSDGAALWRVGPFRTDGSHFVFVDPTIRWADGRTRIALLEYDFTFLLRCQTGRVRIPVTNGITLLDSRDGRVAWSKAFNGEIKRTSACIGGNSNTITIESGSGLLGNLGSSWDAAGTRHGDVFAQTYDFRYVASPAKSWLKATSVAHTYDDRDGREIASFAITAADVPVIAPIPDVSGDGLGDLAVLDGASWTARSAGGAFTYWSAPFETGGAAVFGIDPVSVTGAHSSELAIWTISIDDWDCGTGCFGWVVIFGRGRFVYDATTGRLIWGRNAAAGDQPLGYFDDVASFTGDGALDYYEEGFTFDQSGESSHGTVAAVDGATGAHIWGPRHIEPSGPAGVSTAVVMNALGDVNGDGIADYELGNRSFIDHGHFDHQFVQGDAQAISGADESTIWSIAPTTDPSAFIEPVSDVDGNGTSDFFRKVRDSHDAVHLAFVDGETLAPLWSTGSIAVTPDDDLYFVIDELTGDAQPDVFAESFTYTDNGNSARMYVFDPHGAVWSSAIVPTFPS